MTNQGQGDNARDTQVQHHSSQDHDGEWFIARG
jgi:hypothetical protein